MGEWVKGEHGRIVQRMFDSEASLFSGAGEGGCRLAQAEGGPKFGHLEAEEKLNQSLINKHSVPIGQ